MLPSTVHSKLCAGIHKRDTFVLLSESHAHSYYILPLVLCLYVNMTWNWNKKHSYLKSLESLSNISVPRNNTNKEKLH